MKSSNRSHVVKEEAKAECPDGYPNDVEHAPRGLAWAIILLRTATTICAMIRFRKIRSPREVFLEKE